MVYSPYIVSLEAFAPPGQSSETKGIMAVRTKAEWWSTNHDLHSTVAEGPLEAGVHFAVTFKMDVTLKPQAWPFTLEEIAVYKVADGKIVVEEFFYSV